MFRKSEGGEAKKTENGDPKIEFNFLENFVRRLICQLIDMEERKRAANWLKFLKKNESEPLAMQYLLILMLALNRQKLVRPFNIQPPEKLEPLGKLKLQGMCRFLLEQYKSLEQNLDSKREIKVTYSHDSKQYGCVQSLGEKGVQCYCAFSNKPVFDWDNYDNLKEYSINQYTEYLEHKVSLIDHKISESLKDDSQYTPENFLNYLNDMKSFKMPFVGKLHVRGLGEFGDSS